MHTPGFVSRSVRASARQARGALVGGALLFMIAQLALNVFIEGWEPAVRYPEYGYRLDRLRRRLAEEPNRPVLLALGSSRTEMGLRPDVLPPLRTADGAEPLVFNFGLHGSGPLHELLHLRRILRAGIRPRWVLLEVLPWTLAWTNGGTDGLPADSVTWHDLSFLRSLSSSPLRLYREWVTNRLVPACADRTGFRCRFGPHACAMEAFHTHGIFRLHTDPFGWLAWGDPDPPPERRQPWLAALPREVTVQVNPAADRVLRRLLALCRDEGIVTVLCLMPEGDDFRRRYTPESQAVLDARRWIADADFIDGHHLLQRGARRYTERLGRELIGPLVAGESR